MLEKIKEHLGEILICIALATYIIGISNLTTLGSTTFTFCSYTGTTLLLTGVLTKTGVIPTRLKSRNGIFTILLFISALMVTTAILIFFMDIHLNVTYSSPRPMTTPPSNTHAGDYFDLPGPELYKLGGVNVNLYRPYIWLIQPLLILGGITFIIAIAIHLIP
jgi:hypothetical protein